MRALRTIAAASGSTILLALGLATAAPALASSVTVSVEDGANNQYLKTCTSASDCNVVNSTQIDIPFQISAPQSNPVTVDYQVRNGTAVDGVDFNVPMTGQVTIAADNSYGYLLVPLVNEGEFGTTKTFTVVITKVETKGIGISGGPGTGTIYGGDVPLDCSYSNYTDRSMSLTCTSRPATQTWQMSLLCIAFGAYEFSGNEVTGDGTSSATCLRGLNSGRGYFTIDS